MESMESMNRAREFNLAAFPTPLEIKDFRFGLRRMYLNENDKPSIFTYDTPGRGVRGEHQN